MSEAARASRLAVEIWTTYVGVRRVVNRRPLPELVDALSRDGQREADASSPEDLSAAVDRRLTFARRRPTCLVSALVLFTMLRRRGHEAELVIGLAERPSSHEAHAWVELAGRDVGPPPGRNGHAPMARFG